jgi:hypothetical protein
MVKTNLNAPRQVFGLENRKPRSAAHPSKLGPGSSDFEYQRSNLGFHLPWFFAIAIFIGAGQLFLLEPMLAKMLLPRFGGAPAVWATCVVFFQAVLLAGYAYAHFLTTRLSYRTQVLLHFALLLGCLAFLPIGIPDRLVPTSTNQPAFAVLRILAISAGLPFFLLSSTTPLLQRWFAASKHADSDDPYFFYAASNAGSLLALIAYPFVVEPIFSIPVQNGIWAACFCIWIVFLAICALRVFRHRGRYGSFDIRNTKSQDSKPRLKLRIPDSSLGSKSGSSVEENSNLGFWNSNFTRVGWLVLAFVPSSLMLGCTSYLSADVASFPLLWIAPLAVYLLSFIFVFARATPGWVHRVMVLVLPVAIGFQLVSEGSTRLGLIVVVHLTTLFVASMVCHGELARRRPPAERLTEFYLWLALGGALGSCFNVLISPYVFSWVAEYPLVLALAGFLLPPVFPGSRQVVLRIANRVLPIGLACVVMVSSLSNHHSFIKDGNVLNEERTFFGVYRLVRDNTGRTCALLHGQIWQGMQHQSADPRERRFPLLYYFPTSPIGQVFYAFHGPTKKSHVAVIGLGIGNLAGYAEAGQEFTFYEIDPLVPKIARDPRYFTYLADAEKRGAEMRVVLGDGRLALERDSGRRFGMIILDAFSGDAIPTHLLTREAFQRYEDRLEEDGILALHITNSHVDLEPVVAELARDRNLVALVQDDREIAPEERERGKAPSKWVVLAHRPDYFGSLRESNRWKPLTSSDSSSLWRDDYTNLLPILRWN